MRRISKRPLVLVLTMLLASVSLAPAVVSARPANLAARQGNSFTSELFDYRLEWLPPWIASEPTISQVWEGISLQDGAKFTSFIAVSAIGGQITFDSAAAVQDYFVSGTIAQQPDGTLIAKDRDADIPWAEWTYTGSNGPAQAFAEVITLPGAEAYLNAIVEAPVEEFEDAVTQAAEGITLDGELFMAQDRAGHGGEQTAETHGDVGAYVDTAYEEHPWTTASRSGTAEVTASYAGGAASPGVQPGPAPSGEPSVAWSFETGDDFVGTTAAAVSVEDGLVFTSSNAVYAIDIDTGKQVWTYTSHLGFVAPLALADGVLYAAGEDGSVYAFDPKTGEVVWQQELTGGVPVDGGPVVAGDVLYVTAWDMNAYALATDTGKVLWSVPIGGISYGQPAVSGGYVVISGPMYGSASFTGVLALNAKTGKPAWSYETDQRVFPGAAIVDGVAYFGSEDGFLNAVTLKKGKELWRVDAGAAVSASVAVADGVVYAVNSDSVLAAYDAKSGEQRWTIDIPGADPGGVTVTTTEAGEPIILVGDGAGALHAFDADGGALYSVEVTTAPIMMASTVTDGVIYVSARDGAVYALSTEQ